MENEFIEKNKKAIIEEMQNSLKSINGFLEEVIQNEISPEADALVMRTYMMAISHQVGYLTAVFNQYVTLMNGKVEKKDNKPIGFQAIGEEDL